MIQLLIIGLLLLPSQTGRLQFVAPSEWKARAAASSMRVAEFVVPRVPDDPEDADVIVYFFGGSGGSVDANIERWVGQFKTAQGGPVAPPTRRSSRIGALQVTQIDVSGVYVAEIKPGSPERYNKPNFRMRAAVVETARGPYFVKFTGPSATVARASASFDAFLGSLRFE
jgi:hypothetical protein